MIKNIRVFCQLLVDDGIPATDWSQARDITDVASYALSDTKGDVTFSHNWNTQEGTESRHVVKMLPQGTRGIDMVSPQ